MMAVENAPAVVRATERGEGGVDVERDATTTMMNDQGTEGRGTETTVREHETREEEDEEHEEEYLGRIRRRARRREDGEGSDEDDEDDDAGEEAREDAGGGGGRRRRLKRANGERVARSKGVESDFDSSDSSDLEEEDEELMMERKYAETGRLTDEDVEEDVGAARENAFERGVFDDEEAYSSDSSEGVPVVDDVEAPASGGGRKKTKKQLKKEREALLKEQERMMKKAQKRARFPGWNVVPERMSYMPLIEKLRAALASLPPPPKVQPRVCRQAPPRETNDTVDARDDDDDAPRAEKNEIEIDLDSDEDDDGDDAMLREMLAKKMDPKPASAVTTEPEKPDEETAVAGDDADEETAAAGEDADDEPEEEEEEDSEDELSEEEDMTEEERRLQRKAAKKYLKADRKTKPKAGGELFEDEAEMSEDGGHTDDDEDDIQDDVDDVADAIDFREEQHEDERRTLARQRAFMKAQQEQDDAEVEKLKDMVVNGFKRKTDDLFDSEDRWQRKKKSNNDDESDDDMDYGPVIERPEEAVELSDDDDGEWREQAARRRALQESCTQESLQLPNAFESVVSQNLFAAVKGRSNSLHIESQEVEEGPLARAFSMPAALTRSGSQHGAGSSSMLARQSSKTFLGKKRLAPKGSSLMLGNSQASRSYVFGRNDSQSQWGTEDVPATSFKELGRDEDARAFGAMNTANTVSNKESSGRETKKKQSLFAMMSQGADENKSKPDVQKALKMATQRK